MNLIVIIKVRRLQTKYEQHYTVNTTLCLKKTRTPVTFSNNSNNPPSISTNFGVKNRQLIGT